MLPHRGIFLFINLIIIEDNITIPNIIAPYIINKSSGNAFIIGSMVASNIQ